MAEPDDDRAAPDAEPRRPPPPVAWRDLLDLLPGSGRPSGRAVAGVLVAVAFALGAWWLLAPPPPPPTELTMPYAPGAAPGGEPGPVAAEPTLPAPAADLVVHAAGAVAAPGVHRLPAGARVADLLAIAGGPTPDADLDRVNLAAPLSDGARVWFPRAGEPDPGLEAASVAGTAGAGGGGPAAVIDINAATAEELESLPGIGPAIAASIVEFRSRHGPFSSVEDLLDVAGIGDARLQELRDRVTV